MSYLDLNSIVFTFAADLYFPIHSLAHFHNLLLHIRHEMHCIRASFSGQLHSRFLYLESQTLGLCLALDVNHIVIPSPSHRTPESHEVKLPNWESKEDPQKRLLWFINISTSDFIGILRISYLHYQIRKDERVHFNPCVPVASCHCTAHLLFKLPASRTLDRNKSTTFHFAMVERLSGQKFQFCHLLVSSLHVFCWDKL
jgi:hypothetical protein